MRDDYEAALFRLLEDVPAVPGKPRVLPMTDPALELWVSFAQDIEDHQGEGGRYESISDWTSKLPGAVARIAALLELVATRRWLEEAVIGLNLCPFAKSVYVKDQVRLVVREHWYQAPAEGPGATSKG